MKIDNKGTRIAVIGHLVRDEIVSPDGRTSSALGGIAYNIATLCALLENGSVFPRCRIGRDIDDMMAQAFGNYPAFDGALITHSKLPNVINRLVYSDRTHREEWNSRVPAPLRLAGIPHDIDAALFNFISGNDVIPGELEKFKRDLKGLLYLDFHSLALGRDRAGKRYLRRHSNWDAYLRCADIVQMNLAELNTISMFPVNRPNEIAEACHPIHAFGASIVIIALGADGVIISLKEKGRAYHVPPVRIRRLSDPTGCGDTLAASFLLHYLDSEDPVKSIELSNLYAAAKATFTGLDGFRRIGKIVERLFPPPKATKIAVK